VGARGAYRKAVRIRLLVTTAAAAAVAAGSVPGAHAATSNPQIAGLQVALREQGLYRGAIDAIAGPRTVAAVRAFQRSHGLHVTGIADARTRAALGPLGRPLFGARTLRRGAFGWDVAVLQFLLLRQGIDVPVNAYFDGPTLRGVRKLQRRLHLRADGVVGPHTLTSIVRREPVPLAKPRTIVVASRRHRVHVVRPGESLWVLAKRYHTTIATLARLNHLDPARPLVIGTKLRLPAAPKVTTRRAAYRTSSVAVVRTLLDHWAAHYGVSARLVRALAWMESGYNNSLVSAVGARGIMQIMPATWRYAETVLIGHRVRHDANGNVRVGVAYLRHLLRDFGGNARLALAAWYQGEASVRRHGMLVVSRRFVANVLALQRRV
jgi:LysM repeat protein